MLYLGRFYLKYREWIWNGSETDLERYYNGIITDLLGTAIGRGRDGFDFHLQSYSFFPQIANSYATFYSLEKC